MSACRNALRRRFWLALALTSPPARRWRSRRRPPRRPSRMPTRRRRPAAPSPLQPGDAFGEEVTLPERTDRST